MAVNVVQSALSSRRVNRWLFVLGALVLVAGIVAILVTKVGGGNSKVENVNPTGPAIPDVANAQKNIPFPPAAWNVVRRFVLTAVSRKHLAESYALADANVRGGFTLKEWKTGTIPVPYFPTAKIIRYNWKNTNFTHPREAALNLILVPTKESGQRDDTFQIGLVKVGRGANAHWLVDYFGAVKGVPVPHP